MKIHFSVIAALALLALCASSDAQTVMTRSPALTQPAVSQIQPTDPQIVTINRRLQALEQGLAALQKNAAQNTFTCSDNTHSVNGLGVGADCNQYTCDPQSGRCIGFGQAHSSNDCAGGFSYDSGKCCKPYPGGETC